MPMFYLDDKHRKGEPFLVHKEPCLFLRPDAVHLGQHAWAIKALEAARSHRQRVSCCKLCCPIKPLNGKRRSTALGRLAEKLRVEHQMRTRWP